MADFVKVASTNEIAPGQARLVNIKGKEIVLFNIEGTFFALANACTHEEGPLAEGEVSGYEVTCRGMAQVSISAREKSSVRPRMTTLRATTCASWEPTSRSRFSDLHRAHLRVGTFRDSGSPSAMRFRVALRV
jgi:hypothetical protein